MFCLLPLRTCFKIVDMGAAPPIGFVTLLVGLVCLYVGIVRLVATRHRRTRFLMASILLQLFTLASWRVLFLGSWSAYGAVTFLLPVALGLVIPVLAWIATSVHVSPKGLVSRPAGDLP